MVETRVRKRLRALGISSFKTYLTSLQAPGREDELVSLIDVITVNKTDFFREPSHFDYLTGKALPELANSRAVGTRMPLRVWSAGCSTGEEPYTLAMVLTEYAETRPGYQFSILATDICTQVLERARRAVYPLECFQPVPFPLRKKYLLKSKSPQRAEGRVVPSLRGKVEFRRLNLMDNDYGLPGPMDVIFCRNVIIYFTRDTQERLIAKLVRHLAVGGFLFMGHSETLNTMRLPVEPAMPTVYRRISG